MGISLQRGSTPPLGLQNPGKLPCNTLSCSSLAHTGVQTQLYACLYLCASSYVASHIDSAISTFSNEWYTFFRGTLYLWIPVQKIVLRNPRNYCLLLFFLGDFLICSFHFKKSVLLISLLIGSSPPACVMCPYLNQFLKPRRAPSLIGQARITLMNAVTIHSIMLSTH